MFGAYVQDVCKLFGTCLVLRHVLEMWQTGVGQDSDMIGTCVGNVEMHAKVAAWGIMGACLGHVWSLRLFKRSRVSQIKSWEDAGLLSSN